MNTVVRPPYKVIRDAHSMLPAASVVAVVRNRNGELLGIASLSWDSTPNDARRRALQLRESLDEAYSGWSNIQTITVTTNEEGQVTLVISPNGAVVAEVGTSEASLMLGEEPRNVD